MKGKVEGLEQFVRNIIDEDNQEVRARVVEFLFEITDRFEYELKL